MMPRSEMEPLRSAWRALEECGPKEGWSTIEIWRSGQVRLLAGRQFPDRSEAILVGFQSATVPMGTRLPEGRGFLVLRPDLPEAGKSGSWMALVRKPTGGLELFAAMAEDIARLLPGLNEGGERAVMNATLDRIRGWQAFMEREAPESMSREEELGLFGELLVLRACLEAGVPEEEAVRSWLGPMDGLHDFAFLPGSVEVKTTTAPAGFLATIGSLDQLDHSQVQALFLAGVRLTLDDQGQTLPELVDQVHQRLSSYPATSLFSARLLHAGFHIGMEAAFLRRYIERGITLWKIDARVPVLTRSVVPPAVKEARYVLDLDLLPPGEVGMSSTLEQIGVI